MPLPIQPATDITDRSGVDRGAAPSPRPARAHAASGRGRRRTGWTFLVVGVAGLVVGVGGVAAVLRIDRPLTGPTVRAAVPGSITVPGRVPSVRWPAAGEAALAVPALGYTAQSGPESPTPVASLTKMTVAVLILHDHPLSTGANGPGITVTAADAAVYQLELHDDQSTVAVSTGEVLTERQMLEALLTQSGNNIAYALAVWDAGSQAAFVAKMNALATLVGATSTHYVDASGYDPATVSTAADCLRIAAVGMADPVFAQIVAMPSVTLPLVGTVHNVVTEIGSNHVVGIKSGLSLAAGGCLVLAADKVVGGRTVMVLVAVTGQPIPAGVPPTTTTTTTQPGSTTTTTQPGSTTTTTTIPKANWYVPDPFRFTDPVAQSLLAEAESAVVSTTVSAPGTMVGTASVAWGRATHTVAVVTSARASLAGWPGQRLVTTLRRTPVAAGGRRGDRVGSIVYSLGTQHVSVPLRLAGPVPEPSWWWRLLHG